MEIGISFGSLEDLREMQRSPVFHFETLDSLNQKLEEAKVVKRHGSVQIDFGDGWIGISFNDLIASVKEFVQDKIFLNEHNHWTPEMMDRCIERLHSIHIEENRLEKENLGRISKIFSCILYPSERSVRVINPFKKIHTFKNLPR